MMSTLLSDLEGAIVIFEKKHDWCNRAFNIAKVACQRIVQRLFSTDIGTALSLWSSLGSIDIEISGKPSKAERTRSGKRLSHTLKLVSDCCSTDHLVALTWIIVVKWSSPTFNEGEPLTVLRDDLHCFMNWTYTHWNTWSPIRQQFIEGIDQNFTYRPISMHYVEGTGFLSWHCRCETTFTISNDRLTPGNRNFAINSTGIQTEVRSIVTTDASTQTYLG